MAINIVDVEEVLRQQPHPLTLVNLEALSPAREPYRAILLQPTGMVEANDVRVGHADAVVGHALCGGFLSSAVQSHSDLAVAPEYCVPWSVVKEIVAGRYRPPQGAIWVLGCESISPADFQALAQQYSAAGDCVFHHEPLDARQAVQRRYVDPLLYVFWARNQDGQPVLFLLAQLKTVACRDYRDVEQTSLCLGKTVYAFNRGINSMSLVSIICSDAFDFSEHIDAIHTNCLLIHIQLNPKPAHTDYAAYRTRLCSVGTSSHVELLCLNWARNIKEVKGGGKYADWNNVAGSAWYAPPAKFNADDDGLIDSLHHRGLYYSLLAQRWHSFFLNYEGQIIQLQKQKLLFPGEQALAPKNFVAAVELRLGKIRTGQAQDLVSLAQLAILSLQGLDPLALFTSLTGALPRICLLATNPAMQGLRGTTNLRGNSLNGRPLGGVVVQVFQNHAHGTFTDFRGVGSRLSHGLIFSRVEASTKPGAIHFERDRQELDTIQAQAQQLQSDGLSSKDLSSKLLTAGMAELPSLEELQQIQSNHKETLETLQSAEKTALQELGVVRQECDAMAERLSIEVLGDTDTLVKSVKELISDAEAASGARQILASIRTISAETTAEEITLNLANIQQLLARVDTAVALESANDEALNDEAKNVDDLVKKIEGGDTKITRASDAERVLATVAEQSSGGGWQIRS